MRFLAWIFLILTVAAVVLDWLAIELDGEFVLRSFAVQWAELSQASLDTVAESLNGIPSIAPAVAWLLDSPAAIVFGVAFLIFHVLAALTSKPRGYRNYEPL